MSARQPAAPAQAVGSRHTLPYGRAVWLGLVAGCTTVEVYGLATSVTHATFSDFNRWALRTSTPLGRRAFRVGWAMFAAWYFVHITPPANRHRPSARADAGRDATKPGGR